MHDGGHALRLDAYLAAAARRLGARRAWLVGSMSARGLVDALTGGAGTLVAALGGLPVRVADIRALSLDATVRRPLVVDVTATTTHGCPAVRLGGDVACAEVGAGTLLVAVGRDVGADDALGLVARMASLPAPADEQVRAVVAGDAASAAAWHATSDAAAVIARYLACHPAVARIRYPGLRNDPCFAVAARTLVGGFGAMVSYATVDSPGRWVSVAATDADPREQVMALERGLA